MVMVQFEFSYLVTHYIEFKDEIKVEDCSN